MTEYPNGVYSPRTKENDPDEVYTPSKTTLTYAEDITFLDDEVVAIETELGDTPKWTSSDVAERIKSFRSLVGATVDLLVAKLGNIGIGTADPSEKLEVVGNIKASGYITGKKSGIFASLNVPAITTITTADTYQPISGTFTNSPIENFSAATEDPPGIKYDGALTQHFEIDWHATIIANAPLTTVHCAVFKNGVLVTTSVMAQNCEKANQEYNISGTVVVELAINDEIQLVVTSNGTGDEITFEHYTTTISEFFD